LLHSALGVVRPGLRKIRAICRFQRLIAGAHCNLPKKAQVKTNSVDVQRGRVNTTDVI
jgi:hypothetical protein